MESRGIRLAAIAALSVFVFASCSFAATLVDFKPVPVSPFLPEFTFGGAPIPSFDDGPGSTGNGDGAAPIAAQVPGGLDAETPFTLPPIPGTVITGTGSTLSHDSTLILTGLLASGPATAPLGPAGPLIQPLGAGTFSLFSTGPPSAAAPTLLLTGTISAATFIVGTGNSGATFNSSGVDYTGGVIFGALVASGGNPLGNSVSISMVDVTPPFLINPGTGYLSDFVANATGLFSFNPVPEPSTLGLLALAVIAFAWRRR